MFSGFFSSVNKLFHWVFSPSFEGDVSSVDTQLLSDDTSEEVVCDINTYHRDVHISNAGLEHVIHELNPDVPHPSVPAFARMLEQLVQDVQGVMNFTINWVDQRGNIRYLTFPRVMVQSEGLLSVLNRVISENEGALYGSDIPVRQVRNMVVDTTSFSYYINPVESGSGIPVNFNYYETVGLMSDNCNCLIECFNILASKEINSSIEINPMDVRVRANLPKTGPLSLNHIPNLEKLYGIKVCVVKDTKNPRMVKGKFVHDTAHQYMYGGVSTKKNMIVHLSNHFDVVTRSYTISETHCPKTGVFVGFGKKLSEQHIERILRRRNSVASVSDSEESSYIFFDYETVYDPRTGRIKPYGVCAIMYRNRKKISCFKMMSLDNVQNGFTYWLNTLSLPRNVHHYLIGYNNSRYDNFILLNDLLTRGRAVKNAVFVNNRILKFEYQGIIVRDLCLFLNMSLRDACKSFKCDMQKMDINHDDIQAKYETGDLIFELPKIEPYMVRDVESLAELFFKSQDSTKRLLYQDIISHLTTPSMSYSIFKHTVKKENIPICDLETTYFIRKATIGGRAQIWGTNIVFDDLVCIDCVSLYPFVMMNNIFPIGQPHYVDKYAGLIGVYNCVVHKQPERLIIPFRREDYSLNWKHHGVIECVLTNVDIDCILRHGGEVEVGSGYAWNISESDVFNQYFQPLVDEKMHQDKLKNSRVKFEGLRINPQSSGTMKGDEYNAAIREFTKLCMNALSGKCIERIHDKHTQVIKNVRDWLNFIGRVDINTVTCRGVGYSTIAEGALLEPEIKTPTIWGVLIYAYARTHMYENIISKLPVIYGMDTDSAFTTKSALKALDQKLFGNEFGQFKIEMESTHGIFIAPKCYLFARNGEVIKWRFKGISETDTCDGIHVKDNLISIFTRLAEGETLSFKTPHISRKVINDNNVLELKHTVLTKYISSHSNSAEWS